MIANYAMRPHTLDSGKVKRPRNATKLVHRAETFLGHPAITARTHGDLKRFANRALARRELRLEEEAVPGADRERAAPAARHLPRPPDLMTDRCHHCNEFSRAVPRARERGRGRPRAAGDRAGDAASGRDRARPALVRRALVRPRALGLRDRQARPLRGGNRAGCVRARRSPCSSRSSSPAEPTPSRCSIRRTTRSTASCARRSRSTRPAGQPFTEDTRLHWHPSLNPLATLHAEGKVSVMPAIGYTHPDQSHFTSRHFWEVGATDARLVSGWMGRYLDRVGSRDNPLQGLSLDYQLQPSIASTKVPGRLAGRAGRLLVLGLRGLGRGGEPDARRDGPARRTAQGPVPEPGREGDRSVGPAPPPARAVQVERQRLRQPRAVPEGRQRLPATSSRASRRCSPRTCRSAASRSRRPASTTRTRTSRRRWPTAWMSPRRACSRSSATSRPAASPTAC